MEFFDPHADPKPGFIKEPTADGLLMDSHGDRIFGRYLSPALYKEGERRPVVIMCHGMPGQEQNIDLAQALRRAGCFVSLKKDGELRGCIGTIAPTKRSLAEEICANAVSAGRYDRRFSPVTADELDELVYDVDVLGEPEPVASADELDPRVYGVIVSTADGRRGLLLPDLDGVDSVDEQVQIAAQKGGIDLLGDDYHLERFVVERHL
jgi:AmmeMemoRadiSam system protein A